MIIYGASGHARVIIDILKSQDREDIDYILDDDNSITEILGYKVYHKITPEMHDKEKLLAIGNNHIRKRLASEIKSDFIDPIIHKNSTVSSFAKIGKGTVVMATAVINPLCEIGEHCIINTSAVLEHDSKVENFVHVSPGAILTGNVQVGEGTHIGAGAVLIPGVKIGKWATIGAGSVIIKDIPDYAVVVGNPGRTIKYNKVEHE